MTDANRPTEAVTDALIERLVVFYSEVDSHTQRQTVAALCELQSLRAGKPIPCWCPYCGQPHGPARPHEPGERALLYRFAAALASEDGIDADDQLAARRWMADNFWREEMARSSETKAEK